MNDYLWTLLLLLGYIILSLLGRKKKRAAPAQKPASRSMEEALKDLLGYAAPAPSQPEHFGVHEVPFVPESAAPEGPLAQDPLIPDALISQPQQAAATPNPNPWSKKLSTPPSAREAFILSVIFGAPRAMRSPIRHPGTSH